MEAILALYLDERLRALCRITSFRQGNLTLATSQTTVASQLRYLSRIYTQQLRQHEEFRELKQIRVIALASAAGNYRRPPKPLPRLSADTVGLLQETAALLEDPEISGALERLARHGGD